MTRLRKLLNELKQTASWKEKRSIPLWHMYEGELEPAKVKAFAYGKQPQVELPVLWGGYDKTAWFFQDIEIPPEWEGERVYLNLHVPESLLFVNGVPHQGIDVNHPESLLLVGGARKTRLRLALESYSGRTNEKSLFESAELRVANPSGWTLYSGLKNASEIFTLLPEGSHEAVSFEKFIIDTIGHIDPRRPGSEAFLASLEKALVFFEKGMSKFAQKLPVDVWPVGHSHIDVAWLWRIAEVKRKCGRTFSTALRLIEEYPNFHFVASQPALYAYVKDRYPQVYEQIKRQIHEGRWEPVGGMWVESDCNIPGGEAMVRQLLYGKRFFEQEFGFKVNTLWLPDVFGYSAALPQILKKAEVDYFFTCKLQWNEFNDFPYSAFWWRGIDGTRILSYLMFHSNSYNTQMEPRQLKELYDRARQRGEVDDLLMTVGHGDGGGGTMRMDLESMTWLEKAPGLPNLHYGSVKAFFKALARKGKQLPVWASEIYFEKHRGTYTSHAMTKMMNRRCEGALRDAEIWSSLAGPDFAYPRAELQAAWLEFLVTQFHDIIPGSSIADVYVDAKESHATVLRTALNAQKKAFAFLNAPAPADAAKSLRIYNSLSWTRTDVGRISLPLRPSGFSLVDDQDKAVPMQVLGQTADSVDIIFLAENVPALGYRSYRIVTGASTVTWPVAAVGENQIETPFYRVRLNEKGELERIFDKNCNRDLFAKGQTGNAMETYLDYPNEWEAWDLDADYEQHPLDVFLPVSLRIVQQGPVCTVVAVRLAGTDSSIEQHIVFYQHFRRIDFQTRVDWHERRTILKVAFPVQVHTDNAWYEIQFGALERRVLRDTSWEQAKFEVPAQRWADLSDSEYGLALMNDAKYGYDAASGRLRLTLLRSGYCPDPIEPGWHVQWDEPTDDGVHEFTYSILPHAGSWQAADVVRRSHELNLPLQVITRAQQESEPGHAFMEILRGESLCLETLKRAEDSDALILRLYESKGLAGEAEVRFALPLSGAQECNLLERDARPVGFKDQVLRFSFKPYEIKTFLLGVAKTDGI